MERILKSEAGRSFRTKRVLRVMHGLFVINWDMLPIEGGGREGVIPIFLVKAGELFCLLHGVLTLGLLSFNVTSLRRSTFLHRLTGCR